MNQIKQKEQVSRFAKKYLAGGLRRSVLALTLASLISGTAMAQYPGGGTGSGSYGSKAAIIGGVAAGSAVGVGLIYWKLHNRARVQGCVSDGGDKLVSDNHTYTLTNTNDQVRAGDRVELLGKKTVDKSGEPTFEVYKMTRSLGQCTATTAQR